MRWSCVPLAAIPSAQLQHRRGALRPAAVEAKDVPESARYARTRVHPEGYLPRRAALIGLS